MTTQKPTFSPTDEEIVAYLDGALPEADAFRISQARASDAELDARIAALDADIGALQGAMDTLLSEAPAMTVPEPVRTPVAERASWRWRAVAAAALFAAGIGLGVIASPGSGDPDWRQAVADYQVLYTAETVTATPLDATTRRAGLAHVATRLGLDLDEDRIAVEGLRFQRAQILDFQGQTLGQLVYLGPDDTPIAFCLMRAGDAEQAPQDATMAGMASTSWATDGLGYIVIGPADPVVIRRAADVLSKRLSG